MGYRDESEGLRARVGELEKQLSERDETIARLKSGGPTTEPGDRVTRSRLMHHAAFVVLDRELEFEIDDTGFEQIAGLLRRRDGASVSQVGRCTLRAFRSSAGGITRVRMSADNRFVPIGAGIGALAAGSFLGLAGFALVHDLLDRTLSEAHFLWIAPLCVALSLPGFWRLARGGASRSERRHRATFEAILEIAKARPRAETNRTSSIGAPCRAGHPPSLCSSDAAAPRRATDARSLDATSGLGAAEAAGRGLRLRLSVGQNL